MSADQTPPSPDPPPPSKFGSDPHTLSFLERPPSASSEPGPATPHHTAITLSHHPDHPAPREQPKLTGRRLGEFLILREIGRGGMGIVFEAVQEGLGRRVALKVLRGTALMEDVAISRFHREAETLAKLRHPNIVPVYSVGEQDGTHYYAMELVAGYTLARIIQLLRRDVLGQTNPFDPSSYPTLDAEPQQRSLAGDAGASSVSAAPPPPSTPPVSRSLNREYVNTAVEMIAQVADALHHVHTHGVIHRDVKPGNLILAGAGKLMVLDFGLAHQSGVQGLTHTGDFMGTPMYMSPEQTKAGRETIDHRTDVYSLGVTLYELLSLQSPYQVEETHALLRAIVHQEPRNFRQLNLRLPYDLEVIIFKALEKEPGRRYQSAQDFADDLRHFLNYEAIKAQPPSVWRRTGRFVRRNRKHFLLGGAAAVMALVLTLGLASLWRYERAGKVRELTGDGMVSLEKARASKVPLEADRHFDNAVQRFASALDQDPNHEPAMKGRMDVYRERCQSALQRNRFDVAQGLVLLLKELDRDKAHAEEINGFERQAMGRGSWKVETDPPGCTVRLAALDDEFKPGSFEEIGKTPLSSREIPMGRYWVRFSLEGYPDVNCPVYVGRNEDVALKIAMVRKEEIPRGMVYVPAGEFRFGDPQAGAMKKVPAEGFFIDQTEVTGADYERFVKETGAQPPDDWVGQECPPALRRCAVFNVSWFEAMEYARWAGKRLPTEAEWEKAARGPDGRLYPWGDRFEAWRCSARETVTGSTLGAGVRRAGASPYGCLDMAGNVWEWTLDREKPHRAKRIIRGGAAYSRPDEMLAFRRQSSPPGGSSFGGLNLLGFRCVKPLGKFTPAKAWLDELTTRDDLNEAAEFLYVRREYDKVRECAQRLLKLNPRSLPGNYWEYLLLQRERKPREALARLQVVYFQSRKFRNAETVLQGRQDGMPRELMKVHNLLLQARLALDEKKYKEAEPLLRQVLAVDADNEVAHEGLVEVFRELKRPAEAAQHQQRRVALYRAALLEDPDNAELHNELADFLVQNDLNLKEALALAKKAVEKEPTSAVFLATLAEVHSKLRDAKEALRLIEQAIELDPETDYYKTLRQVYRGGR